MHYDSISIYILYTIKYIVKLLHESYKWRYNNAGYTEYHCGSEKTEQQNI